MHIELHNVCKSYQNRAVLHNVCWTISENTCWRLSGASGKGKTTLLRLLMQLETPDSGTIAGLAGIGISCCFQEQRLCPWLSATENIRIVCSNTISDATISHALSALLPPQAHTQPTATLSGGMQRKVALIRALLPESDIIVLDEPFSGLDEESIAHALQLIHDMRRNRALIFVSHEEYPINEVYQTFTLPDIPSDEQASTSIFNHKRGN